MITTQIFKSFTLKAEAVMHYENSRTQNLFYASKEGNSRIYQNYIKNTKVFAGNLDPADTLKWHTMHVKEINHLAVLARC